MVVSSPKILAQLHPLDGGRPITLERDVTLVGRKEGLCDLIIDHSSVSKMQCLIIKTDGLLFIRDLESTNGTRVNGQSIAGGAFLPGDELAFASKRYRVHIGPAEPRVGANEKTEMLTSFPLPLPAAQKSSLKPGISDTPSDSGSESDVRLLGPDD